MIKRGFAVFFNNKKGIEISKTLIYILIAVVSAIIFGWAVAEAAKRIFG